MVGVPGRSRSCNTCLGRKKGCDRQRPACTQCIKAGLTCGGYDRARPFVNRTQAMGLASTSYRATAHSAPESTALASSAQDVSLPFSLAQTAYNLRYTDLFWSVYLPGGKAFTVDASSFSSGIWISVAMDLYSTERSLQLAMQSVVLRGVGTRDRDRSLVEKGISAYSKCLQEFQKALCDPQRLKNDGLLCATKLLSLYEMHYGADDADHQAQKRSWFAHANGQLAMIGARQPREFRSGKAHQLFVDYRYNLIISSVLDRKRFDLNNKAWQTVPWKSIRKSPHDRLLDILGDLSALLEDIDGRESYEDVQERIRSRQRIRRTCWDLAERLQIWLNSVGELKNFRESDGSGEVVGPRDLKDFALAQMTILYWATCALLYANLLAFIDTGEEVPLGMDPLAYVSEVAFALPFFLTPAAGSMGRKLASFPLGLVMQVYYGTEKKPSKYRDLLGAFFDPQQQADDIAKFVMSMQRGSGTTGMAQREGIHGLEVRARTWMNLTSS